MIRVVPLASPPLSLLPPSTSSSKLILKQKRKTSSCITCQASLITDPDSFLVGRFLGSYGFFNITSYSGLQAGEYSSEDLSKLKTQDIGEGSVKIRLYQGRITQGPQRGTSVIFKVYPGQRAGGVEADMMAANELNTHAFLQSSSVERCQNLLLLLGGFETKTGEQWLAFRNDGEFSAADYARIASEKLPKNQTPQGPQSFWNPYEMEQMIKRRRYFVIRMLQGISGGLVYMHDRDRLHQSLGPASVVLNTISEREARYQIARLRDLAFSVDISYSSLEQPGPLSEGLWRRATAAGAFNLMEKRNFGIADDIYEAGLLFAYLAFIPFCETGIMDSLSLQRLLENTFQLDLQAVLTVSNSAHRMKLPFCQFFYGICYLSNLFQCFTKLQAMLNPDYRERPIAAAVQSHRFVTGALL